MKSPRLSIVTLDDGTIIHDVIGMDPEDEDDTDEDESDEDENDDESGSDEEDEDDSDGDDDEDSVEDLRSQLADAETARRKAHRRMQRADRAKALAEKQVKELKKSDDKKALAQRDARIEELETQLAAAGGNDKTSTVREEFRDLTGFKWHNPRIAFSLLELDEVDVDEKGNVDSESLTDAVNDLAKSHPYLLVDDSKGSGKGEDDDDDEDDAGDQRKPSSGFHSNGRRRKKKIDRKSMSSKYPVLGTR